MTNWFNKFFFFCSGATSTLLEEPECETEHIKYQGIGATVFFTAILAAVSGVYALYKVLDARLSAICFGILWGLMIFNLDRFIVASIKGRQKDLTLPWSKRAAKRMEDLGIALPRILLAVFFSIVITKPLEMRLFEKEIDAQLHKENIEQRLEVQKSASANPEIDRLEQENINLRKEISDSLAAREKIRRAMNSEADGVGQTQVAGEGPVYDRYKKQYDDLDTEYQSVSDRNTKKIIDNEQKLQNLRAESDLQATQAATAIDKREGLAARLSALNNLAKEDIATRGDYTYYFIDWFIVIFFILIELSPIVVKLFTRYGPYDLKLEETEKTAMAAAKGESEVLTKMYTHLDQELFKNPSQATQAELRNAQDDLTRRIIASWRDREINRMRPLVKAKKK